MFVLLEPRRISMKRLEWLPLQWSMLGTMMPQHTNVWPELKMDVCPARPGFCSEVCNTRLFLLLKSMLIGKTTFCSHFWVYVLKIVERFSFHLLIIFFVTCFRTNSLYYRYTCQTGLSNHNLCLWYRGVPNLDSAHH